jgi:hypothetical protein
MSTASAEQWGRHHRSPKLWSAVSEVESVRRPAGAGRVTGTLNHWQLEIQYKAGICYHIFLHWCVSDVCGDHFWPGHDVEVG